MRTSKDRILRADVQELPGWKTQWPVPVKGIEFSARIMQQVQGCAFHCALCGADQSLYHSLAGPCFNREG
jgi:hypothetical protein